MAYAPNDVVSTYSGSGAAGSGLDAYMQGMPEKRNQFFTGQKGEVNDFVGRFTSAVRGQEPLTHMQSRIGREVGLPQLQQSANQLNTTLANIPSTYSGATRGFDVNSNQLDRIVGSKAAGLAPTVNAVNNSLGMAQNQVSTRMGMEQQQQAKELAPYQSEQQLMNDRLSREAAGFTQESEGLLGGFIQKLQAGVSLSTGEQTRANQLAIAKLDYDARKYAADKQFEAAKFNSMGSFWS